MAYTVVAGAGSNVLYNVNPTPSYPNTGMGAGKLAILHCYVRNTTGGGSLTPPAGWTQRVTATQSADSSSIYSRELDGFETPGGTITVTTAGTAGRRAAIIYVIDTAGGTGWNFENIDSETATGATSITDNDVTTGGSNRLALNIIGYTLRQLVGQEDFTGETGGAWIASSYYDSGTFPTLSLQTCEMSTAGTIGGGTDTTITQSGWTNFGFSVWRNASALPDLTVTDITYDSTAPKVGRPLRFSAEVSNIGSGASPSGVVHGVQFSVDGTPVQFATSWTQSIAASSAATLIADGTWTPTVSASSAVLSALVDYSSFITESTNLNNSTSKTIAIVDLPNLQVTDISWLPASPVVGDSVTFSAKVKNAGLANTSSGVVHAVNFEVAGSLAAQSNSYVSAIASSSTATISADAAWLPQSVGTFAIVATANPNSIIDESNFLDNSFSENITISWPTSGFVLSFNNRGPGSTGNIVPLQIDYDQYFLTQGEGDERYLQSVSTAYLTQTQSDARYLQSVPPGYITQTDADAQGMPVIQAGGVGDTNVPIREVNANFTLISASAPQYYLQSYFNISTDTVTASKPAGYLDTLGSNTIPANTAAQFLKRSTATQFRRWS